MNFKARWAHGKILIPDGRSPITPPSRSSPPRSKTVGVEVEFDLNPLNESNNGQTYIGVFQVARIVTASNSSLR